jgi:hypothetical protein
LLLLFPLPLLSHALMPAVSARSLIGFAEWISTLIFSVVARRAAVALVDLYAKSSRRFLVRGDALVLSHRSVAVAPYQHHVIDIVGGFILAGYCFSLREPSLVLPVS